MAWLMANWMELGLIVLLVDKFLMKIFPDKKILGKIKDLLVGAGVKDPGVPPSV